MLFPSHPKPVGRRREVAKMTVRQAQREPVAPGHVLVVATRPPSRGEAAVVTRAPADGEAPSLPG